MPCFLCLLLFIMVHIPISYIALFISLTHYTVPQYTGCEQQFFRTRMIRINWISKRIRRIITLKLWLIYQELSKLCNWQELESRACERHYCCNLQTQNRKICNEREIMNVWWQYILLVLIKNNSKKLSPCQNKQRSLNFL